MASIVQARSVYDGSTSLAFSSNVTAGSTIAVWVSTDVDTITGVSDGTNTYQAPTGHTKGITRGRWFYAFNVASGATTVSVSGTPGDLGFTIIEVSGVLTTDPLDQAVAFTDPSASTTPTTGTFTPTTTCTALVAVADEGTGQASCSAGSGYSLAGTAQVTHFHACEAATGVTAAGHTASFTVGANTGTDCTMGVLLLRETGGGGGGGGGNGSHMLRYWYRSQVSETI